MEHLVAKSNIISQRWEVVKCSHWISKLGNIGYDLTQPVHMGGMKSLRPREVTRLDQRATVKCPSPESEPDPWCLIQCTPSARTHISGATPGWSWSSLVSIWPKGYYTDYEVDRIKISFQTKMVSSPLAFILKCALQHLDGRWEWSSQFIK